MYGQVIILYYVNGKIAIFLRPWKKKAPPHDVITSDVNRIRSNTNRRARISNAFLCAFFFPVYEIFSPLRREMPAAAKMRPWVGGEYRAAGAVERPARSMRPTNGSARTRPPGAALGTPACRTIAGRRRGSARVARRPAAALPASVRRSRPRAKFL